MAKIRVEDVYDNDEDDLNEMYSGGHQKIKRNNNTHRNSMLDGGDRLFAKNKGKQNTCKMKNARKSKDNY